MISFRNIAAIMHPQTCAEAKLDPLPSLRGLIARHRWQSNADTPNSLHDLALRRHAHSTEIHFLFYNTFLLDGFNFDFCNTEVIEAICGLVGIEPTTFLTGIALPVETLLDLFGIGEDVLGKLGIGIDDLASKYPGVVAAALILPWSVLTVGVFIAAKGLLQILKDFNVGIFKLMKAAGLNPYEVIGKLCNIGNSSVIGGIPGLLADFLGVGLDDLLAKVTLKNKPEINERSWEIGTRVASKYDIAALCEIFSPEVFKRLTQAVSTTGEFQAFSGPDASGGAAYLSSGLLALFQQKFKVIGSERLIFQNRGELLRDADYYANKGVLFVQIEISGFGEDSTGTGVIDLYITHTISGNDLLLTDKDGVRRDRQEQVDELVGFVSQTHPADSKNIAIVVGDFNIEAGDSTAYGNLISAMASVDLLDAWPYYQNRTPRPDEGSGHTNASGDDNTRSELNRICAIDDRLGVEELAGFCMEDISAAPSKPATRIDYIFIENPKPSHGFFLDFSRFRRNPFKRNSGGEQYLSDHVGLDITLFLNR